MIYTIYQPETGHITNILNVDCVDDLSNHLDGRSAIEGIFSSDEYYIQDQVAVAKSPKPGPEYEYNYADHVWQISFIYAIQNVRIQRNKLLAELDTISSVRYASLSAEQQADVQTYRQALLDVPQQTGFPTELVWPTKPTWL
jgi:hypothetical protein